jgi:hypothetical protein
LGTTFEQKQQKFVASSPKTTWDKALSTKCTSQDLPDKIKDSQGYAGLGNQGEALARINLDTFAELAY